MAFRTWRGAPAALFLSFALAASILGGCMTVSPSAVELSQIATDDTRKLHDGYRSLVRRHFDALRDVREAQFAERVLGPYVEKAITQGRVRDVLDGKVVWDDDKGEFVTPDPKRATLQKLDTLNTWYRQVASDITTLRKAAFDDLDADERKILDDVDSAFGRVITADATIHAYLVSLQKVESAQRDLLGKAGLQDLPDRINTSLAAASEKAKNWTDKAGDIDKKVEEGKKKVEAAKQKLKKSGGT
jgi:hypothetical protein